MSRLSLWLLLLVVGLFFGWFGLFTWPTVTTVAASSGIALFLDSIFGEEDGNG